MTPLYLTVVQVAEMLQVSVRTVRAAIARKELAAFKFGGCLRIPREELDKLTKPQEPHA